MVSFDFMIAKHYALILGMPGTGKTTTIVKIVKSLLKQNKTVLLTSYTHSAVDTLLIKLLDVKEFILRLGNSDKVHPLVATMTVPSTLKTIEQYKQFVESKKIVATTCLGIHQYVQLDVVLCSLNSILIIVL